MRRARPADRIDHIEEHPEPMELNEALHRIYGQHWRLISLAVVACIAAATVYGTRSAPAYTASTTLVLDTPDPTSSTAATAIADTAEGIARSPSEIARALTVAGIRDRDPSKLGSQVSVAPLGTSGVLKLSVTLDKPTEATHLANSLTNEVIDTRNSVDSARINSTLASFAARISQLNRQIVRQNAVIARLTRRLGSTPAGGTSDTLQASLANVTQVRELAIQQKGTLQSEEGSLLSAAATRPEAQVISPAVLPRSPDPSVAFPDIALGALLGLVLGTGLAALLETLKPRFRGGDALARELGIPYLGSISQVVEDGSPQWRLEPVALVLRLAAQRAGVTNISLFTTNPVPYTPDIAAEMEEAGNRDATVPTPPVEQLSADPVRYPGRDLAGSKDEDPPFPGAYHSPTMRVRPAGVAFPAVSSRRSRDGIAVVTPISLTRPQVLGVGRLLSVMPVPVLGLITCEDRPARRFRLRKRSRKQQLVGQPSQGS
jgi:capsular polysaccharide biosynthesis protein